VYGILVMEMPVGGDGNGKEGAVFRGKVKWGKDTAPVKPRTLSHS
jgi:hypothetical protein